MGAVWMVQQTEPVKRLVALKVIKPGMDSKQVIARFEAERQALALMDHPNIARVLDASATPAGPESWLFSLFLQRRRNSSWHRNCTNWASRVEAVERLADAARPLDDGFRTTEGDDRRKPLRLSGGEKHVPASWW